MVKKKKDKIVRKRVSQPHKEKTHKTLQQWIFVCSTIIFCGFVAYIFLCSSLVSINTIDVVGMQRVHSTDVVRAVENQLAGMKIGWIKNNNYFFLNNNDIVKKIREDQRIESVDVIKQFPNILHITIIEYDVVPVWCVGEQCFELRDGCVVERVDINAPLVHDNRHFVVVDHGHDSLENGQCIVASEDLDRIHFLGEELIYTLNIGIVQPYVINFRGAKEIRFDTDEGWYILADFGHDAQETLDVAELFIKKIDLPSSQSDLEYIDLRFPEKIFYKMKDGVEQIQEQSENEDKDHEEGIGQSDDIKIIKE